MEGTEMIEKQEGVMASVLGDESTGGLTGSDFEIPRVLLLQKTSPDLEDPELKHLEAGMYINSVTKEILKHSFVPLFAFKQYTEFEAGGKLLWSTVNRNDPRVVKGLKWGESGDKARDKPSVTEFLNFMSIFPDEIMPLVLSFKRTGIRVGRQFLTKLSMKPGGVNGMYRYAYKLATREKVDGNNSWHVPYVSDEIKEKHTVSDDLVKEYSEMSSQYKKLLDKVSIDTEEKEEAPF